MYNLKVFFFVSIVFGLSLAQQVSARVTVGRRDVRKYTTTRNLQDAPTKGKTGKGKTGKGKTGGKGTKAPKTAKSTKTDAPTVSSRPSQQPSPLPSPLPSSSPSNSPSLNPSPSPSALPSLNPSPSPSALPSLNPSPSPSAFPSFNPSPSPSSNPSPSPSALPTNDPSSHPSPSPSISQAPSCYSKKGKQCSGTAPTKGKTGTKGTKAPKAKGGKGKTTKSAGEAELEARSGTTEHNIFEHTTIHTTCENVQGYKFLMLNGIREQACHWIIKSDAHKLIRQANYCMDAEIAEKCCASCNA